MITGRRLNELPIKAKYFYQVFLCIFALNGMASQLVAIETADSLYLPSAPYSAMSIKSRL